MSEQETDYDVGYCKPPKETRFVKGQSGNPNGRPKGARGFNASLKREMESKVTIREGGLELEVSKAEAGAKRLVAKGLGGDMAALKMLAMFDADLRDQVEREAEQASQNAIPDKTDDAVLMHFAQLIHEGGFDPGGVVEPGCPDDGACEE